MRAEVEAAEPDSDKRFCLATERIAARELAAKFSKKLSFYV